MRRIFGVGLFALTAVLFLAYSVSNMAKAGRYPEFNFVNCDAYLYFLPQFEYLKQSVLSGALPLWNPYSAVGGPFLAANATGSLYPVNWLVFLLDTPRAILAIQCAGIVIGMAGMTLLLRHLKLEWPAALLGAILFGYVVLPDTYILHIGSTYCWLPLILLFAHRILEKPTFRASAALAALLSLCFLAGHPQYFFYISIITGIYIFVVALLSPREYGIKGISHRFSMIGLAFVLTLGLVAIQILPTVELSMFSVRNVSERLLSSPQIPRTTSSVLLMFDNYMNKTGAYLSNSGFIHVPFALYYMGSSILFVPFALCADKKRRPMMIAMLAALAYSMLFVLSKEIPALSVFGKIPFADSFRWHSRMNDLSQFMIATLAAIGFSALWNEGSLRLGGVQARKRYWFWSAIVVLVAAVGCWSALDSEFGMRLVESDGTTRSFLKALAYFMMVMAAGAVFLMHSSKYPAWLKGLGIWVAAGLIVLDVASYRKTECQAPGTTAEATMNLFDDERIQWMRHNTGYDRSLLMNDRFHANPNAGSMFQLFDVNSYNPYTLNGWRDYMAIATNAEGSTGMFAGILNVPEQIIMLQNARISGVASLRYFISKWTLEEMNRTFAESLEFDESSILSQWKPLTEGIGAGSKFYVYENIAAVPRAYVVSDYRTVSGPEESLEALKDNLWDPLHSVLLEDGTPTFPPAADPSAIGHARVESYGINHVTLTAKATEPALVILTDTYYPGWTASVDGSRKPIWRANSLFRAVEIPPGTHTVDFAYRPASFRRGWSISLVSLLIILAGALLERHFARRTSRA